MNLRAFHLDFDNSPAIRLLRAQSAPYVCEFLIAQFKRSTSITIAHSALVTALNSYQHDLQATHPHALRDRAESYLTDWCDKGWLNRFIEVDESEPIYQLTAHTEQVIAFLDRQRDNEAGFVGTDSRLRLVIQSFETLVIGSSDDPAVHLDHLHRQKAKIEQQIAAIEDRGAVDSLNATQVREQFSTGVSLLKQLQSDFRAVEERFREMTSDLQNQQLQAEQTRGGLLEQVLDAEDALRADDQGVSFYEFFRFIQSPEQQDRLRAIIHEISRMDELRGQQENLATVKRMMSVLLAEASRVTQTERRLSSVLRRMLDKQTRRQQVRVAGILSEIRSLAASMANDPPREVGVELETNQGPKCPFARPFWSESTQFDEVEMTNDVVETDLRDLAFDQFAELERLDLRRMRLDIRQCVSQRGTVRLKEFVELHPVSGGIVELLGYLQIAADDGHHIESQESERILIRAADERRSFLVTVPLVTLLPTKQRRAGQTVVATHEEDVS